MDWEDADVDRQLVEQIKEFIDGNATRQGILERIIQYEENNGGQWDAGNDVPMQPSYIGQFKGAPFIEVTLDTNTFTELKLKSLPAAKQALNEVRNDDGPAGIADFEPDIDVGDLFQNIVGYEEIKERFRRSLTTRSVRQSILLVGPRASAKTLFLREVGRIKKTSRISGGSLTPAGLEDEMIDRPSYIIFDEIDEVQDAGVYSVLLNYQDATMPHSITKSGKNDTISLDEKAPVFASANSLSRMPEPNQDRFWVYHFEKYDEEEFTEICTNMLPRRFEVDEELAEYIASRLREWSADASIRDAERVAEVVNSREEVNDEVAVLEEYR